MRNYRAADDFGTIHENLERVLKRAWREEPATTPGRTRTAGSSRADACDRPNLRQLLMR